MKLKCLPLMLATVLVTSGCASILSDSQYPVTIGSTPSDATFTLTNRAGAVIHTGTTPATVTLKAGAGYFKGETYTVLIHKDGYDDQQMTINSSVDGWYFGNILVGGLIGMLIVDPATGAMFKLPASVETSLAAAPKTDDGTGSLTITMIDQLTAEQREQLVRVN